MEITVVSVRATMRTFYKHPVLRSMTTLGQASFGSRAGATVASASSNSRSEADSRKSARSSRPALLYRASRKGTFPASAAGGEPLLADGP